MHVPAPATRHPTTMSAAVSIVTNNATRRVSDRFMTASCAGWPPRRALRDLRMSDRGVVQSDCFSHVSCPSVNWDRGVVPRASHSTKGAFAGPLDSDSTDISQMDGVDPL